MGPCLGQDRTKPLLTLLKVDVRLGRHLSVVLAVEGREFCGRQADGQLERGSGRRRSRGRGRGTKVMLRKRLLKVAEARGLKVRRQRWIALEGRRMEEWEIREGAVKGGIQRRGRGT